MIRSTKLKAVLITAALAGTGALAGIAGAAAAPSSSGTSTSTTQTTSSQTSSTQTKTPGKGAPPASGSTGKHHCPNMGSSSGSSNDGTSGSSYQAGPPPGIGYQ
jgi:hypothetical protein